jgi:heterodisulfide reductase subunit B
VLHVSQLVGLAIGLAPQHLALSRNVVGCDAVLRHVGAGYPLEKDFRMMLFH